MGYPDDLLEQARHLAKRERTKPRQTSLRRAVSTAYYAIFHLLTSEVSLNWKQADQRFQFARLLDHGRMKSASRTVANEQEAYFKTKPVPGHALDCARNLHWVVSTFSRLQEERHEADYDGSTTWERSEVIELIELVENAFQNWRAIRNERVAQDYLMSMLGRPR
jgi:uncharacterized protein (UPF0332 family)